MDKRILCQSLFTFDNFFLKKYFSHHLYPYEIVNEIKNIAGSIVNCGIEGYVLLSPGVLIGQNVKIADTAMIDGPTIIGNDCEIRHGAYIRGGVILGRGCIVGNSSEIKDSLLLDGAKAPHFNYVGNSVLGNGAHLGAGAICSNLKSDGRDVVIRGERLEVNTGLRKFGAVLGDGVEIGCGAVLCPGTVIGKNTSVYPLTITRGYYPEGSIVKDTYSVVKKEVASE